MDFLITTYWVFPMPLSMNLVIAYEQLLQIQERTGPIEK
jgi:hypothetical protein